VKTARISALGLRVELTEAAQVAGDVLAARLRARAKVLRLAPGGLTLGDG
jgi:hypothetical protein